MKSTRLTQLALGAATVLAASAAVAPTAQAAVDDSAAAPPTFKQFVASTYQDVDGAYVVNGDEAHTMDSLHDVYEHAYGDGTVKQKGGTPEGIIVNNNGGALDVWSASQVANLTYCVSDDFGADKAAIVAAMAEGAGLWENASSAVDFTYVSSADSSCTTSNSSVLFPVEPVQTSQYIARAFFPSSPDSQSNVLVDDSIFNNGIATPANVLSHELGHVLGFRHEHTRPEANPTSCYEDDNWTPATPYDSESIMHYPQCNGSTANTLSFSAYDGEGVRAVYGG